MNIPVSTSPQASCGFFERAFRLRENRTNVRTELIAGLTTFMTMAYILAVNPSILSTTGMDKGALVTATALSAGITTILMGLWAKYPFALAPGMGLNAFFAFTVVKQMGVPWQVALAAVFVEGVIFILLSLTRVREAIFNSIPANIKLATSVGIGLFIAFIGLQNVGLVSDNPATLVGHGDFTSASSILAFIGLVITIVLVSLNVNGALLWGILLTTAIAIVLKALVPFFDIPSVVIPKSIGDIVGLPPSLAPIALKMDFQGLMKVGLIGVVFTFLFVDMFDTIGTLVGISTKAGFLDADGRLPRAREALTTDAIGTVLGACLGTSTVTSYVESAAGVAAGGRTGLTAVTAGVLLLLAAFFAPLMTIIPPQATAPALVIVGFYMMQPVLKIDFSDPTEAIPAFFTILFMPLMYSIAHGLYFGILSYTFIKLLTGKGKQVSVTMYILSILFILNFIYGKL